MLLKDLTPITNDIDPESGLPVQIVRKKGKTELVLVAAGEFTMGSDNYESEMPAHEVYLDAYYIAKHPVTHSQYRSFVKATKHAKPALWEYKGCYKWGEPVTGVSWMDAQSYCKWAELRLPTEAEWEKSARGTDGRKWPWGNNQPSKNLCNFDHNVSAVSEVDSYPNGASPCGCLDMAGNVWEWCHDWYDPDYYTKGDDQNPQGPKQGRLKVLRGGAYGSAADSVRCACRGGLSLGHAVYLVGFRCAL